MGAEINIKIDGGNGGLMGISLKELLDGKPTIVKKQRKKKAKRKAQKDDLLQAVESTIPKRSKYETEVV